MRLLTASLLVAISIGLQPNASIAKKITVKYARDASATAEAKEQQTARGSFLVASQCTDCNNGYKLSQISFAGFDKPARSAQESFFITNNTDRTMSGVALYIEYLAEDGRQLHKRFLKLDCEIPAGETRRADIKSWDTQHSFHYIRSNASKTSTPFTVQFDPVSYRLRF